MNFLLRLLRLPTQKKMPPPPPLISVIGATGTGKSQLAVELALKFNGEVINADAMQLYKGLPIITNKITDGERKGVPHHLLGFLDTRDKWEVGRFIKECEKTIEDIRKRGKLPVLVGGTHYYVQSLLYPHTIPAEESTQQQDDEHLLPPVPENLAEQYPILDAPTPALYEDLQRVDPVIAARWHPNDRRKIRRSLEIYYSTGCKQTASEIYAAQRAAKQQPELSDEEKQSKHRNLIFWVHAETEPLRQRLNGRVGKMINAGMWEEIEEMEKLYDELTKEGKVDLNSGIWQSIGFKEFVPYLELRKNPAAEEKELEKLRLRAVEDMKTATRRYAKIQVKWIRIKFINALLADAKASGAPETLAYPGNMFLVDSTDVPNYDTNVVAPAINITKAFLDSSPLPDPLSLSALAKENLTPHRDYDISTRPDLWASNTCEHCEVTFTNMPDWQQHLKSGKHKKRMESVRKRKEVQEFLAKREQGKEK
ncbi:IPP transferase-domain-containing protein [Pyronema domesticum]|nr:IPP transferase-domain-containing protein [Pyronema domesticum]